MSNRIKLKGTSERSFDIGLGPKMTLDANSLTANRTWVLPDSNGVNGYVLSTDGSGNLSWAAQTGGGGGNSQARIQFTAASNGTGQTFTDSNIASFPNNTFANVFVNGVMLQTSEYSISSTTLTVSRYLTTGDNIIVAATSVITSSTGIALSSIQTLSTTSETVVLSYALPTISAGVVFRSELTTNRTGSSTGLTYIVRLRVGTTGTTADTVIYSSGSQGTVSQPVKNEFTITFDSSTSTLNVLRISTGSSSAGSLSAGTTGLTPTYLTLTIEASVANVPTQYLDVIQANIVRIL